MATLARDDRLALAEKRLISVLRNHSVATARTLEQKISDAGPTNQRIDPHILTDARRNLAHRGIIRSRTTDRGNWFYLAESPPEDVEERFREQQIVHARVCENQFTLRLGQTLEIAVWKALQAQTTIPFFGGFRDLDQHDDSSLYKKIEPPESVSGKSVFGGVLDFLLVTSNAGLAGVEVKNIREWLYPDRDEVTDLLVKCCSIDAIPVLIARRVPFVTFRLLNPCGVVIHQTFNQLFPASEAGLAREAAHKRLLGYHDIRVGNDPDPRLLTFTTKNLPIALSASRSRFDAAKELLSAYASGGMPYAAFAENVKLKFGRGA
jgi:hypothetical protein